MMEVNRVCIMLEIDGQTSMALLDGIDKTLLIQTLGILSPTGKLRVIKLDDSFVWTQFQKHDTLELSGSPPPRPGEEQIKQ